MILKFIYLKQKGENNMQFFKLIYRIYFDLNLFFFIKFLNNNLWKLFNFIIICVMKDVYDF